MLIMSIVTKILAGQFCLLKQDMIIERVHNLVSKVFKDHSFICKEKMDKVSVSSSNNSATKTY